MHRSRTKSTRGRGSDDVPLADRAADWVGEAIFNGHIAVWSWHVADARGLLPPGMELAEVPSALATAPDRHPVVFVHGEQTRGANFFAGIPLRSGLAYHEAGILVPFVRRRGRAASLTTAVPAMYADFFPPVWHDEAYYGLGKRLVAFRREGLHRLCVSREGRVLLDLVAEPRGEWRPAASCAEAVLEFIRTVAALPIVGRMSDGSFVGSHFLWDFRPAFVRAADSLVELHAGAVDGVPPRSCPDVRAGTLEVRDLVWRLGWPGRYEP